MQRRASIYVVGLIADRCPRMESALSVGITLLFKNEQILFVINCKPPVASRQIFLDRRRSVGWFEESGWPILNRRAI
jgi:hypothetical protein